jgi:hypothetical protein
MLSLSITTAVSPVCNSVSVESPALSDFSFDPHAVKNTAKIAAAHNTFGVFFIVINVSSFKWIISPLFFLTENYENIYGAS